MPEESARGSGLPAQQEINIVMVEVLNRLKVEIKGRSVRLQNLRDQFSFLLSLIPFTLSMNKKDKIQKILKCFNFASHYHNDVAAINFFALKLPLAITKYFYKFWLVCFTKTIIKSELLMLKSENLTETIIKVCCWLYEWLEKMICVKK